MNTICNFKSIKFKKKIFCWEMVMENKMHFMEEQCSSHPPRVLFTRGL